MNNHRLFSCIFTAKGSIVGGTENIQLLIMRAALAFSITAMAAPVLRYNMSRVPKIIQTSILVLFNVFCVNPIATFVANTASKLFRYLKQAIGMSRIYIIIIMNLVYQSQSIHIYIYTIASQSLPLQSQFIYCILTLCIFHKIHHHIKQMLC